MKLALNDSGKYQNKGFGDKEVIFRTMVTEIDKYNSYYDNTFFHFIWFNYRGFKPYSK